jgi:hypothetical protein
MRTIQQFINTPEEYHEFAEKIRETGSMWAETFAKYTSYQGTDTIPVPTREETDALYTYLRDLAKKGRLPELIFYTFNKSKFFGGLLKQFAKARNTVALGMVVVPSGKFTSNAIDHEPWKEGFHEYIVAIVKSFNTMIQQRGGEII